MTAILSFSLARSLIRCLDAARLREPGTRRSAQDAVKAGGAMRRHDPVPQLSPIIGGFPTVGQGCLNFSETEWHWPTASRAFGFHHLCEPALCCGSRDRS